MDLDQIKADYDNNGFAIIPQFINSHQITLLNQSLHRALSYTDAPETPKTTHFHAGTRIVYQEGHLHRIVWAQGIEPAFALSTSKNRIRELINTLLGCDTSAPLDQIINQLHIKRPQDGVSFRYHQDAENRSYNTELWNDLLGNGSFIQTVLALGPLNKENGSLEFLSGSHKEGFLSLDQRPAQIEKLKSKYPLVTLEAAAGDLVIFHPFCVHGSAENKGKELRKVFINGFCPPGANRKHYPGCGLGLRLIE